LAVDTSVQHLFEARQALGIDFFGGWLPADLELFEKYHFDMPPTPGFVTDYFGVKTAMEFVPWAKVYGGKTLGRPPIPDDSVRAETIEYFALLDSLENTPGDCFTMIELGASYAPWACIAGVLATRSGKRASVRAVEASSYFHALIAENFAANGLGDESESSKFEARAIHGAVGVEPGSMFFPIVENAAENGGQAAATNVDKDYLGRSIPHEEVPVRTLDDIFEGCDVIDFMHCDIQGSEEQVLIHGADQITQKVRHMFVGTHSRKIEGLLIECYHDHGWKLVRDRPVTFSYQPQLTSVVGMTTRDGGQYWVNTKLTG